MKLLVRASVLTLVFAGALASAFTPQTHATSAVRVNSMVVSSALPIPSCPPSNPGSCGLP